MTNLAALALACSALILAGCASSGTTRPARTEGERDRHERTAMLTPQQSSAVATARSEAGSLRFDDEIVRLCPGVQGPRFDYDSHAVQSRFQDSLVRLAECIQQGGLRDKQVLMVGHADPRGDDDYNLALGGRRADAVRQALDALGVNSSRIEVSSRGEVDARGWDEATWAEDRRVDVKLRVD